MPYRMTHRLRSLVVSVLAALAAAPAFASEPEPAPAPEAPPHSVGERLAASLRKTGLPDSAIVALISTLPLVELRGAIPVGHVLMMPSEPASPAAKWRAAMAIYALAVAGNMVPVPFILLLLGPLSRLCMRTRLGKRFFDWLFARTRRKTADIEKYETLGLTIFVAIPLPATGAWTGAMAAFVLGMRFRHAMWANLLGVMIAGVIMTALALLGWIGAVVAGVALLAVAVGGLRRMLRREERGA